MSASPPASLIAAAQVGGVQAAGVEIATFHVKYLNVKTPLRDGVKLAGDLYLPAINGVPDDSQAHTNSGLRETESESKQLCMHPLTLDRCHCGLSAADFFLFRSPISLRVDSHSLQQEQGEP